MTTPRPLQTTLTQRALALSLAAVVTFGVLAGVAGQAGSDRSSELVQQLRAVPQVIITAPSAPQA